MAAFELAGFAWSQQNAHHPPIPAADAALPAAPQAQTAAAQPAAELALPGSIHGVVEDRDGTVCEGAQITLLQAGSATRSAISDSGGSFDFADVPDGAFQLTISGNGFATQVSTGLLHSGESYQAPPVRLLISTAASEVRVTASQQEIAQEQFKEEEEQRVLGFIPNFYVSYAPDAPPLAPRQKFHLAWRSSIDPITFVASGFFAGIEQADNSYSGFGEGAEGYAKRYGANYADEFIGTMLGGAVRSRRA